MKNEPIFIDTSAFYVIIDRSDSAHKEAARVWSFLLQDDNHLITSNYIILETIALLQNRISCKAALLFQNDILSVVDIHWISQTIHELSVELWKNQGHATLASLIVRVLFLWENGDAPRLFLWISILQSRDMTS